MGQPVLEDIVRQHAEQAAFLWGVWDYHLLHPGEVEEMDALRLSRVAARLEAHIDGLRIAGEDGKRIAQERFAAFPERGELFVCRMLEPGAEALRVPTLDLDRVRAYLDAHITPEPE